MGCPRSGTGLLRDLLRSHPHLAFPTESHFIPRFFRAYGDPATDREARRLGATILGLYWVKPWRVPLTPSDLAPYRSYGDLVARIFAEYARQQGKERWGDKTPNYVREIPTLMRLFPNAKVLHIIRDGRDVALSWMKHWNGAKNLFTAATHWKTRVTAGREAAAMFGPDVMLEVRYETLLADTRGTMRAVCEFVDEPFTEAVLAPTIIQHPLPPPILGARARREHPTQILAGNRDRWRQEMSRSDRTLFESVAGELLATLGYETEGLERRISRLDRFAWRNHHRLSWARARFSPSRRRCWFRSSLRIWWAGVRPARRSRRI